MIEMNNITKFYGNFRALNNVSLKVERGEIIGLLGPNGAGKTTAMRILTCFLPATEGQAVVAGYDVFEDSLEVRRRIGYLPETPPLYPEMTVRSYLNFVGDIRELSRAEKAKRIGYVAERIGLQDHIDRIISTLSKGYRQRVGLAQALLHNPTVLILDEPTVGLDPIQIMEIRDLIKDIATDHTIILSTHILPEVSMTCDRVVIINEGEIVAEDSVANLENKAAGKPSWKIKVKLSADNEWKKCLDGIEGHEIKRDKISGSYLECELSITTSDDFEKFLHTMAGAGHIFTEIVPIRQTLEDVFIRLTAAEEKGEAL